MENDEDYFFYGRPLEEEVESKAGQHAKDLKDPAATKSLPVWQQVCPQILKSQQSWLRRNCDPHHSIFESLAI